ncbi:MAG: hypothetical protein P8049_07325 [Gemmatimonadota bacterium]
MEGRSNPQGLDWETLAEAWQKLGLGDLRVEEPGPGLLELRIADRGRSAVPEDTIGELLRGLLAVLAGQPVGLARGPADDPAGSPIRFLIGSPRLLARIGPDYESGVEARALTTGAGS